MDVRVGLWRKLSTEELILLNCGVGEDSWESLGLQGYPTSPIGHAGILNTPLSQHHLSEGDQPWVFFGTNDAKAESPVLWPPHVKSWLIGKESDAGKDWGQEEKGTTWVWVNSGSCWWTGRPGVLQFMGLQRVGHDWATELNWTDVVF